MSGPPHRWNVPLTGLRKRHFFRTLPRSFLGTILESGPSFTRHRRYSVRGEFGALYFSASQDLSFHEVASRGSRDTEQMSCVEFEITADCLVDLTRPEVRSKLHVQLEDLVRPRISRDAYVVPQTVAKKVYAERLHGLIVPSPHDPQGEKGNWFNLVLYPANLIRAAIREIRVQDVP